MESWLKLLRSIGGTISSGRVRRERGIYVYRDDPPSTCPRCGERGSRYHAHGSFLRWLKTWLGGAVQRVRLRKPRYLCLRCEKTFSLHPPETLPYKRLSTFLIVLCLWSYLDSSSGLHHCLPGELSEDISARTVVRHLSSAKALAVETQQAIREVLIRKTEPRPVEELFPGGLDPPESLRWKQSKEPDTAGTLWRALFMLRQGAETLAIDPRTLLAWAQQTSRAKKRSFLL
jgi:transposase